MKHLCCTAVLVAAGTASLHAQVLKQRPAEPARPQASPQAKVLPTISLTVPAGTPLKVTLDREVRVRRVGQTVHAKTTEPIYAFDKLLLPAGSEVTGTITGIDSVPAKTRTLAAMDANFSPERRLHLEFDQLVAPDGRRVPIHTVVTPGTSGVLQFVPANARKQGKVEEGKQAAKGRIAQARQDVKRQIELMKNQLAAPDKMHRLERFALTQSPYRPQYLDLGTSFNADVQEPLAFGSEQINPAVVANLGTLPPSGGVVHAWLAEPLSSTTNKQGDPVEAIVSQPLIVSNRLYLPEGSELKGTVLQVRRARRFGRNGQLRIAFHQVVPPNGTQQIIEATIEGLEVAKGENLALDSEGGAQVKSPKTRYLTTGIAVMLAASSASPDQDRFRNGGAGAGGGDMGGGALNGASGFKLVGMLVGAFARSRSVVTGLGVYGAARSIYAHFLARGRDVVYPKDMSMVLALGLPAKQNASDAALHSKLAGH